ncbi:MAG: TIGR04283 family arsenosugar biosynthesis glycosyltransferase [Phycisphaerae bacterium]
MSPTTCPTTGSVPGSPRLSGVACDTFTDNSIAGSTPCQRLSVIIPARNEEGTIARVLECLCDANLWEVIVVDGQSDDRTREIAHLHGALVIQSQPGRGRQLNIGAAGATGDTLLFLHADTLLPPKFDEHVFRVLARPRTSAGAFRLRIDAPGASLRLIEQMVNYRSRFLQMPYGDQAIFVKADAFRRVGGFPQLPVMEDYELVRRLRRLGRIEIAPAAVVTSARRWLTGGVWRTTLYNRVCVAAYRLGVHPDLIARWRDPRNAIRGL